jgi:hypothetical protein
LLTFPAGRVRDGIEGERKGSGLRGRGCLFWLLISVVLSVTLTVLVNLVLLLL